MDVKGFYYILWISFIVHDVIGDVVHSTREEQRRAMLLNYSECQILMNHTTNGNATDGPSCPRIWDDIMCWPETDAGSLTSLPCPPYINKFKIKEYAFRECLPNGTWLDPRADRNLSAGWTNFSMCVSTDNDTRMNKIPESKGVISLVTRHEEAFRLMYNTGYFLSLISLLFAVVVMLYFRRLHCARNCIHLNLFVSFLLRAALSVIRDNTWKHHLGFPSDVEKLPNGTIVYTGGPHWECRSFFTLYNYVLVASYMWIFMEAVYIHMIIFVAVFSEKTRVIYYMVTGWTLPLPFVIAWALSRAILDNTYCWHLSENWTGLSWFIQGPVILTVVLNFFFFINIVRVLLTKLNTFPTSDTSRYRTLAKSIVVLIPMFGVYYIMVAFPNEQVDDTTSFVMLLIEMFFNSYQGLFIAVLLCFTNAEVRTEIKDWWTRNYQHRMSTMSRGSQMYSTRTGSLSTTSDVSKQLAAKRRHQPSRQTSVTDLEQAVPFTNTLITTDNGETDSSENRQSAIDTQSENDRIIEENGYAPFNSDKLNVKINVVNIECKSRDGLSKYTTSLDIQALTNGRIVRTENILNNNVVQREYAVPDGEDTIHFMDDRV